MNSFGARQTRRLSLTALTLLASVSCGGRGGDSVAIGVALNPKRAGMHTIYRGVELAVEQLNAERGGKGTPIVMRRVDSTITGAVQIATILREDPSVVAIVGHPESGATLDAAPVFADAEHAGEHAVAAISPTATSPALSGRSQWLFRVCPTDLAASRAAARYVLDSLHARRAAIIYRNDPYGKDWSRAFEAAFKEGGGTIVQRDPYLAGITDWGAYAAYLKTLGAQVLLFPGSSDDAEQAIRALRAANVRIPFLGGDATSPLQEKAAEFSGAQYTAFFEWSRATAPEAKAFIDAYRRKYGEPPDQRAALSYDAALLIGRAVAVVGTDRKKIRDYLDGVGRSVPAMHGVTGPIAFDTRHDAVDKTVVIATVGK